MKKINLLISLTLGISLLSCSENDEVRNSSDELSIPYLISRYGNNTDYSKLDKITMSASSIGGTVSQIDFQVHYLKSVDKYARKRTKHLSVQNQNINSNRHTIGNKQQILNLLPSYGKYISIKKEELINGGFVEKEYKVYNPKLIPITNKSDVQNFKNEKDLIINWEPDKINNKPIHILMVLRSIGKERKLVPRGSGYISKIVKDTGSFRILARDLLKVFPDNGRVDVFITRGNQKIVGSNAITLFNTDLVSAIVH